MAAIPVNFLLERLGTFLVKEAKLLGGIRQEIEKIREELESIKGFLEDADKKRDRNEGIKTWVNQVRRVAYDIEDAIDEFLLRFGTRHAGYGGIMNFLGTLSSAMTQLLPRHNLATRVQEIKKRIVEIAERRRNYDIQMLREDTSPDATIRQWRDYAEANFLEEAEVVGIEKDVKLLVNQLVGGVTGNNKKIYISVVGMGGLGKTTLARKVYNEPKVKKHFNCSAWVSVSQSFNTKTLLKFMLIEFGGIREPSSSKEAEENLLPSREEIEQMDEVELGRKILSYLQGKKFILVLDDVWDETVCIDINSALVENNNGSGIMITTRIESVTSGLETIRSVNFIRHELKTFPDDVAMSLLCRKAFPGSTAIMPPEFQEVGKSMLQKCGGLPLAITTLGGILCKKSTVSEWEKVNQDLSWQLGSITSILKLSYDELPLHLKPCFLYCGLFPEDHLIKRSKLIRLWIAEGFIEERSGATAEEVGEDYMLQLIDRSMLQIAETSMDGRVKSCRIHDLMRDLAISISREEEFSFILDMQVRRANVVSPRRMSVFGENKRIEDDEESVLSGAVGNIQLLRSLLFFRVGYISTPNLISHSGQFMLLRVLDLSDVYIEKLPKQIGHLLHLRYLCFRTHWELTHRNRRPKLPRSIGSLQNLETLDIRDTDIRMLPNEIIRLRNLRHLCMAPWNVDMPKGFSNLRCLQTLTGLDGSRKGIAAEIRELKELRRLDIEGVKKEDAEEIYGSISSMRHLFRLRIEHDDDHDDDYGDADFPFGKRLLESPPPRLQVLELRQLWELPDTLGSFNNLSKLTLTDGPFREDPFPRLESLPCLSDLRLYRLYNVDRLECGPLGFLRLRRLQLVDLTSLRTVTFAEGSMPSLKQLWIHHCGLAKVVPHGIQHLKLEVLSIK
ncbi:putative disease resistance RPP13-like protein 3 isoform X1 [Nymphaea colorata]|uniref:AAA+ ATPase domain-containing protein n=1 Tax=Nymphaea colorata TaxID=210225 RepID=A0A5K1G394_9MAGN|nr:putative disease resistance RPP13-like protein 3 isoform X1 [Nymphaea colorata]